ncbi:hypothetical protein KQI88_14490 [Alkaliphilus sp. MSJ-5]|uniref:Sporulation protein YjcZ n=1 Tax=Alkaliphilus flagellatus TaxID=2841507 RepID=A0ABS6G5I2_9FIRM|nr:hypothetical protein [Alkaliphilus flagellatus]MBU5677628.1 hypothetical protein [Alkaliphilus flagellatus]
MSGIIESGGCGGGFLDGIFGGNKGCGGTNNLFSLFILIIILCFVFGRERRCGCGREFCDCKR